MILITNKGESGRYQILVITISKIQK